MLHIFNAKDAKQAARAMEKYMATLGFELKLSQAMDTLGVMSGFQNWAALRHSLGEQGLNAKLSPGALRHIEENSDNEYGREYALVAHTGFELRYEVEGDVTYLRVCDPLGREIAYWVSDEWAQAPEEVIGAVLGALVQGEPVIPGKRTRGAASDAVKVPSARAQVPTINSVPFDRVISVEIGEHWHLVTFADADVLAKLDQPEEDPDAETDVYHKALTLGDYGSVELGTLRHLTWDAARRCFVNGDGLSYKFNLQQSFADAFEAQSDTGLGTPVLTDEVEEERRLQVYEADNAAPAGGVFRVAAWSKTSAVSAMALELGFAFKAGPIDRVIRVVSDEEAGPFRIFADDTYKDTATTLVKAMDLVQSLEATTLDVIEIVDTDGRSLWSMMCDPDIGKE